MSGTLRESGAVSTTGFDEPLTPASPSAETSRGVEPATGNGAKTNGNGAKTNGNGSHGLADTDGVPAAHAGQDAAAAQAEYVASLELRLAELVEIEKMRDLEIHHLEAELGQHADRAFELETALFHSERRAKDLERRWNDLAEVYETAASALVVAGGQLEAIQHQAGYRLVIRLSGLIRRHPTIYRRLHRRLHQ